MGEDLQHLLNWSKLLFVSPLTISPIVHPRRWDLHGPKLINLEISLSLRAHPLLASILAPRVPQICVETALFFLSYLQSSGHSAKTQKSLKSLLKSSYFTRLKIRPWLSRCRNEQHRPSGGHCLLDVQELRSAWWGNHPSRPNHNSNANDTIRVPLRFFSYRSEYSSNYDLWYTYQYALQLLPVFLTKAPPDSRLASIATDCIFNSFCTAYPRETRKAKKSITQYLSRCRSIRAMPLGGRSVVSRINVVDVDYS